MKVCQSISSISRVAAGVSGFVLPLSQHLAELNMTIEVLSLADEHSLEDLPQWQPLVPTLLKHRLKPFGFSEKYKAALDAMQPAVIHQHGLWMYPSFAVFNWAKNNNIPHIVSPHGMLETWSWNHNHWKKKPIWQLWEKNNLNAAAAIHVTSVQEMHSVRARGITAPVAVIPIGIDIPDLASIPKQSASGSKKTLLFLSRIHPVKGLENLIQAWQQVKHPDWQIIIAGPGDAGYIAELNSLVQKLGLTDYFIFKEALYGDDKWSLMANADVFVLPSFNENFGLVIAEALACEVPVITTTATPWEGLLTHDCGWWVEVGVDPLIKALNEVTQLTAEQLKSKGKNGRLFVENEFNWQESALKMKSLYEWAAHKTDKPAFVYL